MKDYAKAFYKSKAWKGCQQTYKAMVGGLCEECLANGIYTAGVIVHHKVHITPDNITDENVTLNYDNLKLVCRDCHAREHQTKQHRYYYDDAGTLVVKSD